MGHVKRCAGIDVGLSSACIAVFGHDGGISNFPKVLGVLDIPTTGEAGGKRIDVRTLWEWIGRFDVNIAYVENATAMPAQPDKFGNRRGMGGASMARYMRACGAIEAAVTLAGVESVLVMPAVWKRALGLLKADKSQSIALALSLCPEARAWLPTKTRKGIVTDVQRWHNRAESILIAVYAATRTDMIDLKPNHSDSASNHNFHQKNRMRG